MAPIVVLIDHTWDPQKVEVSKVVDIAQPGDVVHLLICPFVTTEKQYPMPDPVTRISHVTEFAYSWDDIVTILLRVKGTAEGNSAAVIIMDKEQAYGAMAIERMIHMCEQGRDLFEQRRLVQDKTDEAEVAKRRIAGLEHEVDTLLVKADVRQIETERLREAAAGWGGNKHDRNIQELELAMEKQRRGLEEKVRETKAKCSRLKARLNEVEGGGKSVSLADMRADIQKEEKRLDPAAKKKMLEDLALKWHPDNNPVMRMPARGPERPAPGGKRTHPIISSRKYLDAEVPPVGCPPLRKHLIIWSLTNCFAHLITDQLLRSRLNEPEA
eukprot:gene4226-14339_t